MRCTIATPFRGIAPNAAPGAGARVSLASHLEQHKAVDGFPTCLDTAPGRLVAERPKQFARVDLCGAIPAGNHAYAYGNSCDLPGAALYCRVLRVKVPGQVRVAERVFRGSWLRGPIITIQSRISRALILRDAIAFAGDRNNLNSVLPRAMHFASGIR